MPTSYEYKAVCPGFGRLEKIKRGGGPVVETRITQDDWGRVIQIIEQATPTLAG